MLLGGFDGMHRGHLRLLERAKEYALPVAVMTISGGKGAENLFTLDEREDIFRALGADFVFELPFSEIKDLSPEAFLAVLKREFSPRVFLCGEDFRFGAGAVGTPSALVRSGGVKTETEELLKIDGEKVSSSAIRSAIAEGDVARANALLCGNYFLKGRVIKDRGVGRTLAFPTANIPWQKEKFPLKTGVYETQVRVVNTVYRAITNYGTRPTFGNETLITETYLDGFSGDLYGETLSVEFVRRLRDVKKFESAEELKAQLNEDIRRVRNHD